MGINAVDGPLVQFGQVTGVGGDYNEERAPALFDLGTALLDPRAPFTYVPGNAAGHPVAGWLTCADVMTINATPSTPSAVSLATAAANGSPTAGVPLTLVSVSGAGVTVGASVVNALTGVTVTGLWAIDGVMGQVAFGSSGTVSLWDPTKAVSRVPTVASVGADTGATFTIAGYDIYGFPMTQVLTGASGATATCTKAFKYIASITPAGSLSGSAVTAGFNNNIVGLPIRSDVFADIDINTNNTWITANTGYVAAVTTAASGITGDVRGTYTSQTAFTGSVRIVISQSPLVANVAAVVNTTVSGLFGVPQF